MKVKPAEEMTEVKLPTVLHTVLNNGEVMHPQIGARWTSLPQHHSCGYYGPWLPATGPWPTELRHYLRGVLHGGYHWRKQCSI